MSFRTDPLPGFLIRSKNANAGSKCGVGPTHFSDEIGQFGKGVSLVGGCPSLLRFCGEGGKLMRRRTPCDELLQVERQDNQIGRAHVWTPVTPISRMPSS